MPSPRRAAVRRQDRPAHRREASREERRHRLDDVVRRLEPRDEPRRQDVEVVAVAQRTLDLRRSRSTARGLGHRDFPKAHVGLHLVQVAADRLGHRLEPHDVGVDGDLHQAGLATQSPQHAVEEREAIDIAMQARRGALFDERARHVERGLRVRRIARRVGIDEQRIVVADRPGHVLGRDIVDREASRGAAPAGEVGLVREDDRTHRCSGQANSASCPLSRATARTSVGLSASASSSPVFGT